MDIINLNSIRVKNILRTIAIASIAVVYIAIAFATSPAHAQTGVKLQPALIEDKVEPGVTISKQLTVSNVGDGDQTYYLIIKDITDVSDNGAPIFSENEEVNAYDLSSWIIVENEQITVAGGEEETVNFKVQVPADATPGGHFGGIFISLEPVRPDSIGTGVGYQVGSIISIQVGGEIFEDAQIREFISDKSVYGSALATFTTRVENKGNILVRPRGTLEIYDMFNKKVATEIVNDSGGAVFPAAEREFETVWEGEGLNFGRYQVVLALGYGQDGSKTISSELSFWILPSNIIFPFLGVILFIIILIYVIVRLYIKSRIHAMGGDAAVNHYAHSRVPLSRLTVIAISLIVFTIVFLMILFFTMA